MYVIFNVPFHSYILRGALVVVFGLLVKLPPVSTSLATQKQMQFL